VLKVATDKKEAQVEAVKYEINFGEILLNSITRLSTVLARFFSSHIASH